jgi:ankyrin repeat protein
MNTLKQLILENNLKEIINMFKNEEIKEIDDYMYFLALTKPNIFFYLFLRKKVDLHMKKNGHSLLSYYFLQSSSYNEVVKFLIENKVTDLLIPEDRVFYLLKEFVNKGINCCIDLILNNINVEERKRGLMEICVDSEYEYFLDELIKRGVDPYVTLYEDTTTLSESIYNNNIYFVEKILESCKDKEKEKRKEKISSYRTEDDKNYLMISLRNRKIFSLLLPYFNDSVNPNIHTNNVNNNQIENTNNANANANNNVNTNVDIGKNINHVCKNGLTVFMHSCMMDDEFYFNELFPLVDVNLTVNGRNCLFYALFSNFNDDRVDRILSVIDVKDIDHRPLICRSAKLRNSSILAKVINLFKGEKDLFSPYKNGKNIIYPLHVAISSNMRDNFDLLLKEGCSTEGKTSGGYTALIFACMNYHQDMAITLINKGASVYPVNDMGKDALYYACMQDLTDVVSLLLSSDV